MLFLASMRQPLLLSVPMIVVYEGTTYYFRSGAQY
jgi:hypothetical protein